jgi:hypothetical protein
VLINAVVWPSYWITRLWITRSVPQSIITVDEVVLLAGLAAVWIKTAVLYRRALHSMREPGARAGE